MESRKLISTIEACFPKVRIDRYRRVRMGWETVVLEINEKYIFRFLNLQRRWPHQEAEIELLSWLAPKLDIRVPGYEYVWRGSSEYPQKFAGYLEIPGSPASKVLWSAHFGRLAEELGTFITGLHRITPTKTAPVPRFSRRLALNWYRRIHQDSKKFVYPMLDDETKQRAETFWRQFLETYSRAEFTPKIIHSDLSGGNLIIDPMTGGLNGVIDWGNTRMDDPAREFMSIFALGPLLGEAVLSHYGLDQDGFMERINFYLMAEPFEDIITGVRSKEESFRRRFIGEGMTNLRRRLG